MHKPVGRLKIVWNSFTNCGARHIQDIKTKQVVLEVVKVPLTDNQLAALTSFTYNCGRGALYQLVSQEGRLNDGNYDSVAEVMPMYRKAGGKVRKGLVKRRQFEVALWNAEL